MRHKTIKHLKKRDAEGINVAPEIQNPAMNLFGSDVKRRTNECSCLILLIAIFSCEPEIHELETIFFREHQVGRLDVQMNDSFLNCFIQTQRGLQRIGDS